MADYDNWKLSGPDDGYFTIDDYYEYQKRYDNLTEEIEDLQKEIAKGEPYWDESEITEMKCELEVLQTDLREVKFVLAEMQDDTKLMKEVYENSKY